MPLTTIQKRARRKYLTYPFIFSLIEVANSPMKKAYWNTYHCCKDVWYNKEVSDRYLAKYCKNKWCLVCASIRTAQLINAYKPVLETWKEKSFLTLTVKNCSELELRKKLKEMNKIFYAGIELGRKRKGIFVKCVKKMECTYSETRKDYHPHFHVVTETKEQAEFILDYWLKHFEKEEVNELAQKVLPASDGSMVELFKYFTKIITKGKIIPPENLNAIFCAIKGMHTVRPYGFSVALPDDPDEIVFDVEAIELKDNDYLPHFGWEQDLHDWISWKTGEMLSGYEPSKKAVAWTKQFEEKVSKFQPITKQLNTCFNWRSGD